MSEHSVSSMWLLAAVVFAALKLLFAYDGGGVRVEPMLHELLL